MLRQLFFIFLIAVSVNIFAQDYLYKNDKFTLYSNGVKEGKFESKVISPQKMVSNYSDAFEQGFSRFVRFKFCINGEDNENPSGNDHTFYLNPIDGKQTTSIYKFGAMEESEDPVDEESAPIEFGQKIVVKLRLDMSEVFNSFGKMGHFKTNTGSIIKKDQFRFVSVSGGTPPLNWTFSNDNTDEMFIMKDDDNDNIYELDITFKKEAVRKLEDNFFVWELVKNTNGLPKYSSDIPIVEALYNLSLEEMLFDIREDGAFMAGLKWEGVWTRDISYSIILSLAAVNPDASKASLMAKVKDGMIIQDTGTGGSWPVSTDRMVWALAAWEIFKVTGDMDWLRSSYNIIKKTAEYDSFNIFDNKTTLVCGESSFLDWREQTYPRWMDPKDIYTSKNLGTNAVHYRVYTILDEMAELLGEAKTGYAEVASEIKEGVNNYLWSDKHQYFGQYLYGRNNLALSERAEALGTALMVLYNGSKKDVKLTETLPVTDYGVPCIFPQIPNMPNYHNNGIWPFVVSYYTWAAVKENNTKAVEHGLASIFRAAGLFLTNKENMVANNGNCLGTEINSDRQLWSVAGNLAAVYRVLFGMEFKSDKLEFNPLVPKTYQSVHKLKDFKYRNALLDITVEGYGNAISEFMVDGKSSNEYYIPGDLNGKHTITIRLNGNDGFGKINLVNTVFAPETPGVNCNGELIEWKKIDNAKEYHIYKNGKYFASTVRNSYGILTATGISEYQVMSIDKDGNSSFLSEPVYSNFVSENVLKYSVSQDESYITLSRDKNTIVTIDVEIAEDGKYYADFCYANGNGPINTDNKCAIRTLYVDDKLAGTVVLAQRGTNLWDNWGYSNTLCLDLKKGNHQFKLEFNKLNQNMNIDVNKALLKHVRVYPKNQ